MCIGLLAVLTSAAAHRAGRGDLTRAKDADSPRNSSPPEIDVPASRTEQLQLDNVDLQETLQKRQLVLQTLLNIAKMVFDQAAAAIRKFGG